MRDGEKGQTGAQQHRDQAQPHKGGELAQARGRREQKHKGHGQGQQRCGHERMTAAVAGPVIIRERADDGVAEGVAAQADQRRQSGQGPRHPQDLGVVEHHKIDERGVFGGKRHSSRAVGEFGADADLSGGEHIHRRSLPGIADAWTPPLARAGPSLSMGSGVLRHEHIGYIERGDRTEEGM